MHLLVFFKKTKHIKHYITGNYLNFVFGMFLALWGVTRRVFSINFFICFAIKIDCGTIYLHRAIFINHLIHIYYIHLVYAHTAQNYQIAIYSSIYRTLAIDTLVYNCLYWTPMITNLENTNTIQLSSSQNFYRCVGKRCVGKLF